MRDKMETQHCTKCHKTKSIDEFAFRDKKKNIRRKTCKVCQRKYDNAAYKNNKKRRKDIKENKRKRKLEKSQYIQYIKENNKCKICGDSRWYVLDFHHRDQKEKDFNISNMRFESMETVKMEIDKCDILCSNCHRELHYFERISRLS